MLEEQRIQGFLDAKAKYVTSRLNERDRLIGALIERGYAIMNMMSTKPLSDPYSKRAGRGLTNYTGDGRIAVYDLSNWMWINTKKNGVCAGIALQAHEADKSGLFNHHVLYDRIAFEGGLPDGQHHNYVVTNYDLPLSDDALHELMADFDRFVEEIMNA